MLYGILHSVLSISFGAIVQIVIFFLQNSNILKVQASLPPGAEDEIILIEHLPGRRVHLQDFFWSDAKDAPPWVDTDQGITLYETRTVHHTVTLYSPTEDKGNHGPLFPHRTDPDEPKCTTCIEPTPRLDDDEDQNIGVLIAEDPGPRYWLLTVLRANQAVPPKIELKLARLYKTAFSRQQQRHLGLLQTDLRFRRVAREHELIRNKPEIANQEEMFGSSVNPLAKLRAHINSEPEVSTIPNSIKLVEMSKFKNTLLPISNIDDIKNDSEYIERDDFQLKNLSLVEEKMSPKENLSTTESSADINENITDNINQQSSQGDTSFNLSSKVHYKSTVYLQNFLNANSTLKIQMSDNVDGQNTSVNKPSKLRSLDHSEGETVQVRMQNTSVTEGGATKLIYSVHLGGKPVPAERAARDMALLSPQEVALELGAPVLIQSEPYLKETRPLALSRKKDAWLLIGAASAGFILLALVVVGLILAAKRKRAHSAVAAPPSHYTLKKKREYIQATNDFDNNAFSTSEMEIKTDGTSQRQTPRSLSRTPVSLETPDSLEAGIHEVVSDDEEEQKRALREPNPWEQPSKTTSKLVHGKISRTNAVDTPQTSDSTDVIVDHLRTLDSLENNYTRQEEATASPHSYLSMPSCKPFPSMKTVEPLSKVLEPVMVKHLDVDSPEMTRRDNDHLSAYRDNEADDRFFARTSSAIKDPGVIGPIVRILRKQNLSAEGNGTSGTDVDPIYVVPSRTAGNARRRLNELLEDSFSLFGSRDPKTEIYTCPTRPTSATHMSNVLTIFSETKGRSTHVSPVSSPSTEIKSHLHTSASLKPTERTVAENGHSTSRSRSDWSSRPLSAGPFHRPNLPDIDTRRILTESQLSPEDPAVPLIASIKKELEKFSSQ